MEDIETYLAKLKKRYQRFFKFDRFLSVILALSSGISLYEFINYETNKAFHLAGTASTLLVACLAFSSNQLLLKNRKKGRNLGYLATALFIVFRISAPIYLMWTIFKPFGGMDADVLWNLAPMMFFLLFFIGTYRGIYHLAAHNYVKIFLERKLAEQSKGKNSGNSSSSIV